MNVPYAVEKNSFISHQDIAYTRHVYIYLTRQFLLFNSFFPDFDVSVDFQWDFQLEDTRRPVSPHVASVYSTI